jgi:short-subunit dehydrogenase
MYREHGMKARRRMGWATLTGAALVFLFWALYIAGGVDLGQTDPVLRGFESAFPVADLVFCVTLLAAGASLLRGKAAGAYFLALAGAISVYLGALDLTFYGRQGAYYPLSGEGIFQLSLSLICVGMGGLALRFSWTFWREDAAPRQEHDAPTKELRDRVIVLTGSANGIGAATAQRLAEEGAMLALADIDEAALERQRTELSAAGHRIVAIPADVADSESVTEMVEAALLTYGKIDVLVNCAGIVRPGGTDRVSDRAVREQIETNLLGTIHTTRAILPIFLRRGHGQLLHVSSLGGIVGLPGEATYSATKFGVRGFCQALALEYRDTGIRVSAILPDSTDTAQMRAEAVHGGSPLSFTGRPLAPEQVARAIVRTIRKPQTEVYVPRFRGWLARLAAFMPSLLNAAYPALERMGRRGRDKFRLELISHGAPDGKTVPEGAR